MSQPSSSDRSDVELTRSVNFRETVKTSEIGACPSEVGVFQAEWLTTHYRQDHAHLTLPVKFYVHGNSVLKGNARGVTLMYPCVSTFYFPIVLIVRNLEGHIKSVDVSLIQFHMEFVICTLTTQHSEYLKRKKRR